MKATALGPVTLQEAFEMAVYAEQDIAYELSRSEEEKRISSGSILTSEGQNIEKQELLIRPRQREETLEAYYKMTQHQVEEACPLASPDDRDQRIKEAFLKGLATKLADQVWTEGPETSLEAYLHAVTKEADGEIRKIRGEQRDNEAFTLKWDTSQDPRETVSEYCNEVRVVVHRVYSYKS